MSAITGIFYRDGRSVDSKLIKKMNDRLVHRGLDGSFTWCEGAVAFGHQMLHTTPESLQEKLPFEDENSRIVITADARIDNREELSELLGLENIENVPDSLFILKAYEKWGESCPEKLLGDFAFAIWDRDKKQLCCARDHMGVKPFYYYLDDGVFVFGTEIKALFAIKEVPYVLNKLKMAEHLSLLFNDKEITFYEDIFRLSPAHNIIIDMENVSMNKYWDLDINKEIKLDSDEEYAKAFLEIFKNAVNCRLRSPFPLGSLLSGGLDSSSIVCTARQQLSKDNKHLETYSATFESTPECDEQYYINKVIEGGRLKPHYIEADKLSPLSQIEEILWHFEEPNFAVNFYFHWYIHQEAMKNGVRVILEGFDGDTTISHGEKFLMDYFKSFKWIKGIKEFYRHSEIAKKNISKKELLLSFFLPFIPVFLIDLMRLLRLFPIGIMGDYNLINEELSKETNVKKQVKNYEHQFRIAARSSKTFHYFRLNSGLQSTLERIDKSAAAACLEARYPFFDRRLIEFCLALPIEQKINNGWTRIILRRAMENILPEEIQWRPDKGMLGLNFRKNFLLFERHLIEDILFNQSYLIKDYVNMDSIYKMYDKYTSNKDTSVLSIFGVVNITIWIQKIFNKPLK